MNNLHFFFKALIGFAIVSFSLPSLAQGTLMLRQPDISAQTIAFVYAGDIWIAGLDGEDARRLTSHPAQESRPQFSPDGNLIAFSAAFDGNVDVYVVESSGGQPRRLTWHPGADLLEGWSADGGSVMFTSTREINHNRAGQIYHLSVTGGHPEKIMEARAMDPAWSGDGSMIAYRPFRKAHEGASGWRQHRGGSTPPVWIYNPATSETVMIPHDNSSDFQPHWVGSDVYFLSDRDGSVGLHGYNAERGVWKATDSKPWDILSANTHGNSVIYDAGGALHIYDTENESSSTLTITINPDLPERRVQWKNVQPNIEAASLSPSGKRAIITARGDVFTAPLKDGSMRNVTSSDGVRDMTAIWSLSGEKIAYLSDASGQYRLVIAGQNGEVIGESYQMGEASQYYQLISFSPDDGKVIYRDTHLNIKYIDLESGDHTTVATDIIRSNGFINGSGDVVLSPDGKWLSYTLFNESLTQQLYLYNMESGEAHSITDTMADAAYPAFSPDGKYLYFTASTNKGTSVGGIDMSTQERPYRAGIYAAVLQADGTSPLLPKSDEEEAAEEEEVEDAAEDEEEEEEATPDIDIDGLEARIVAYPVAERNYSNLNVAADGTLYYRDSPQPGASVAPGAFNAAVSTIMRFNMEDKKAETVKENIIDYSFSHDGKMMLIIGAQNAISTTEIAEKIDEKTLNLADLKMRIDPSKEWLQIFNDAWRMEADFFYAANMHGLDWQGIYDQYRPLVDHVGSRDDLTLLIVEMIAEMQVGHNRSAGGDGYKDASVNIGLLGADIRHENGNYRLAKIYSGERWNPFFAAPLAAPGIGIAEGDYILSVNGQSYNEDENFFAAFEGTSGKQVTLTVSANADGSEARDVVVVPNGNERNIRLWHWIESNRAYVSEASDGRVGYVYVPNTAGAGFTFFNRMYFSQLDKDAMIIDERSNGGGQVANYITDVLSREYLAGYRDRDGMVFHSPIGAMYGPKVMLIDQDAGSGGDFLPYAFRHMNIGKLIGTRTWGGLIGVSHNPVLVDGGRLSVPYTRLSDANGEWLAENTGIAPDIEVNLFPADVNAGIDAQLDRGIAEVLEQLETHIPVKKDPPPIPDQLGQ